MHSAVDQPYIFNNKKNNEGLLRIAKLKIVIHNVKNELSDNSKLSSNDKFIAI